MADDKNDPSADIKEAERQQTLTIERLREELDYNPETGVFTYKIAPARRTKVGDVAGTKNAIGYAQVFAGRKRYLGHRLAWFYVHEAWPDGRIDHINGDKSDNRIANLRLASQSENCANAPLRKHSTSGIKGVTWHKGARKWTANVTFEGKTHYLGLYDCPAVASIAYQIKADELHGEFARVV